MSSKICFGTHVVALFTVLSAACGQDGNSLAPSEKNLRWTQSSEDSEEEQKEEILKDPRVQKQLDHASEGFQLVDGAMPSPYYFYAGDFTKSNNWGAEWYRNTGDLHWIFVTTCADELKAFFWRGQKDKCDSRYENRTVRFTVDSRGALTSSVLEINLTSINGVLKHFAFNPHAAVFYDWLFHNSALGNDYDMRYEFWLSSRYGNAFVNSQGIWMWRKGKPWLVARMQQSGVSNWRRHQYLIGNPIESFAYDPPSSPDVKFVAPRYSPGSSTVMIEVDGKNLHASKLRLDIEVGSKSNPRCYFRQDNRDVIVGQQLQTVSLLCERRLSLLGYEKIRMVDVSSGRILVNEGEFDSFITSGEILLPENKDHHYTFCGHESHLPDMRESPLSERHSRLKIDGAEAYLFYGQGRPHLSGSRVCRVVNLSGRGTNKSFKITRVTADGTESPAGWLRLLPPSNETPRIQSFDLNFLHLTNSFSTQDEVKINGQICAPITWASLDSENRYPELDPKVLVVENQTSRCRVSELTVKSIFDDPATINIFTSAADGITRPEILATIDIKIGESSEALKLPIRLTATDIDRYLSGLMARTPVGVPVDLHTGWGFARHEERIDSVRAISGGDPDHWLKTAIGWVVSNGASSSIFSDVTKKYLPRQQNLWVTSGSGSPPRL